MRNTSSTIYLRHKFGVPDPGGVPALRVKLYVDDGCIIWINGQEVARRHVAAGEMRHDSTSGVADHEREWEWVDLPGPGCESAQAGAHRNIPEIDSAAGKPPNQRLTRH